MDNVSTKINTYKEMFDIISLKYTQSSEQSNHFNLEALHLTRSSVTLTLAPLPLLMPHNKNTPRCY